MNYDSVEQIINAGITNMIVRVDTANDDGTITISGTPSWIVFNGSTPTTMYTNGNTWIGVGAQSEHITFNRRDTKIYYFYTEEGTLYEYYRFYKMRWKGYSKWNETGSAYAQEWEVIFFDTGDILIHAVTIPTAYYDGTFRLVAAQTYSYTAPTTASPYVSFYSQDDNNSTFTIEYDIMDIPVPFDNRWLIEDGDVYYNITDGVLTPLSMTELTAQNILTYGNTQAPDGALLISLQSPTIYRWNNSDEQIQHAIQPQFKTVLSAVPFTQIIAVQVDMSHETITGIRDVAAQYEGNIGVQYSIDDGTTYTTEQSMDDFLALDFSSIFESLPSDKVLYLKISVAADSSLTKLVFNFNNS